MCLCMVLLFFHVAHISMNKELWEVLEWPGTRAFFIHV